MSWPRTLPNGQTGVAKCPVILAQLRYYAIKRAEPWCIVWPGSARLEASLIDRWRFRGLPLVESFGFSGARPTK